MESLGPLETRMAAAAPPQRQGQPDAHRRRIAVARFRQEAARALATDPPALKRARLEVPMTQAALCALAGVSRDTLRRAEGGDSRVSPRTWHRLAVTLGVRAKDITP